MATQLQPNNRWRVGRVFWVRMDAPEEEYPIGGFIFLAGDKWIIKPFGRVQNVATGLAIRLTDDSRAYLEPVIAWADEQKVELSQGLKALIKLAPSATCVRGFVRAEVGIVPPKDETPTTTEDWLKFVESLPSAKPPEEEEGDPPAPAEVAVAPAPVTRRYTVSCYRRESGHCTYETTEVFNGALVIPDDVIAMGIEALEDYILDHVEDEVGGEDGHYDYDNHESDETGPIQLGDRAYLRRIINDYRSRQARAGAVVPTAAEAAGIDLVALPTGVTYTTTPTTGGARYIITDVDGNQTTLQ